MDKEKEIEEMAKTIVKKCLIEHNAYYDRTAEGYISEISYNQTARNFVKAGYGNVEQAIKQFAKKLKEKSYYLCDSDLGTHYVVEEYEIDELIEEFINAIK